MKWLFPPIEIVIVDDKDPKKELHTINLWRFIFGNVFALLFLIFVIYMLHYSSEQFMSSLNQFVPVRIFNKVIED